MPSPITDPGYRYATEHYPGDGVTVDFEFNFAGGYLDRSHVEVSTRNPAYFETLIPANTIVWVGPNQIRIPAPVATGMALIIRRNTPKDLPLLDFVDGAILNEKNLNTITKQAIFSCAEMVDLFADLLLAFQNISQDAADALAIALQALAAALAALAAAQAALAAANAAAANAATALMLATQAAADAAAALIAANAALAGIATAVEAAIAAQEAAEAAEAAVQAILGMAKKMEIACYSGIDLKFNNYEVVRYITARPWVTQTVTSGAILRIAPANLFVMSVQKNGISIASVTWAAGQVLGVFDFPTDGIEFDTGDILSISTIDGDPQASALSLTVAGLRIT